MSHSFVPIQSFQEFDVGCRIYSIPNTFQFIINKRIIKTQSKRWVDAVFVGMISFVIHKRNIFVFHVFVDTPTSKTKRRNTTYKVKVRAKNLKAASYLSENFNSLSSGVLEVTTKPKGLPEPPLDLQVIKGPREGTITLTWLPVTINPSGTSNGAPVLGYIIYADGKQVTTLKIPTFILRLLRNKFA